MFLSLHFHILLKQLIKCKIHLLNYYSQNECSQLCCLDIHKSRANEQSRDVKWNRYCRLIVIYTIDVCVLFITQFLHAWIPLHDSYFAIDNKHHDINWSLFDVSCFDECVE